MSHPHRFYTPNITQDMAEIILPAEEAHHASRVARLRDGDGAVVFNGAGLECSGPLRITSGHTYLIAQQWNYHPPPRVALILAVGGLHRDKTQEEVIRRAAELGVSRVCFWRADHSQRPIAANARWRKTAVEACKQCGRAYIPQLDAASSLDAFFASYNGPSLIAVTEPLPEEPARLVPADQLALIIGPEGDFSERERETARMRNATPVSLGRFIYRTETAAAILATIVADRFKMLGAGLDLAPGEAGQADAITLAEQETSL